MKLLMENWRKYVSEVENSKDYGTLYLFEEGKVRQTSFYDRFMSLNESENDFDVFFEQWERSANYELDRLDEINWKALKSNPVLYLSTQAYVLIAKAKDKIFKYIGKIKAVLSRASKFLQRFEESNPKLYKVSALAIKVAVALVAVTALNYLGGGGEAMAAGELHGFSPADAARGTSEVIANAEQLEALGELLKSQESTTHQDLGAKLIELAQSSGDMDTQELARQIEGLDTMQLENFVEKGVAKLTEIDANAAEAAQDALEAAGEVSPDVAAPPEMGAFEQEVANIAEMAAEGDETALARLRTMANQSSGENKKLVIKYLNELP